VKITDEGGMCGCYAKGGRFPEEAPAFEAGELNQSPAILYCICYGILQEKVR
jgi:hypothetical protein